MYSLLLIFFFCLPVFAYGLNYLSTLTLKSRLTSDFMRYFKTYLSINDSSIQSFRFRTFFSCHSELKNGGACKKVSYMWREFHFDWIYFNNDGLTSIWINAVIGGLYTIWKPIFRKKDIDSLFVKLADLSQKFRLFFIFV